MFYWSAFMLGFVGSLHCLGMCGPIALALPTESNNVYLVISRFMYNVGRILTYGLLGYVAGIAGRSIAFAGWQNTLSIALGVIIIAAILVPRRLVSGIFPSRLFGLIGSKFSSVWKELFGRGTMSSFLAIGILNGFLPCGLVYVAVAASMTREVPLDSVGYMALFGLGTLPAMFAVSLIGPVLSTRTRLKLTRLVPVGAVVLGCLLILRGMSLGIPYVSPSNTGDAATTQSCH